MFLYVVCCSILIAYLYYYFFNKEPKYTEYSKDIGYSGNDISCYGLKAVSATTLKKDCNEDSECVGYLTTKWKGDFGSTKDAIGGCTKNKIDDTTAFAYTGTVFYKKVKSKI